jgi:hypothetical protein
LAEPKGCDDRDEPHGAEAAPTRQEEMPHSSRASGGHLVPLPGRTLRQNPATQEPLDRLISDGKEKISNSASSIISQFRAARRVALGREEASPTQKKKRREETGGFFTMTARKLTPRKVSREAFRVAKPIIPKWTPPPPLDSSVIAPFDHDNLYNTFDVDWFSFNSRGGIDQNLSDDSSLIDFNCDNI